MGRPPLDPAGTTAAAVAAARSNPEILRATDNIGSVLLHWISLRGEAELAKIVIFELGAAVDPLTSAGQTPLHWAASKGHVDVMCVLLDAGANIDAKDVSGSTPLIVAVQHTQFLALLLLLDRGASLIAADARGCSAVHWAAYKGDASALHALHRRGADLGAIDDDGLTPLHRAARGGSTETARYLIERGGQDVRTTVVVKRAAARAVGASPPSSSSTTAADQVSPSSTAAHNGSSGKAPPQATTTADGDGTTDGNRETGGRGVVRARLGAAVPAETSTSSHAKVSAVPSAAAAISSSRALSSTGSVSSLAARTQSLARSLVSSSSSSSPLSSRTSGAPQPHNKQTPSSAAAEVVTVHDGDDTGEDAVQAAEDALRIMASSSAAAGGMFNNAQAQQVLLRQRACVMYLRAQRAAALDEGLDFAVVDRTHRGSSTSTSSSLKCCKWAGVRASLRRVIRRVFSPQGIRWVLRPAIAWLFLFAVPLTVLMWQLWSVVPPAEPTDSVFIAHADELLGSSTVRTLTHWAPVLPFLLVMVLWGGGRGWLRAVPLDPYGLLGSGSSSSRSSSSGNSEPCITSAASVLCRASGTVVSPPGFKSSRLVSRAALTGAVQSAAAGSAAVAGASSLASNGSHVDALFSDMDHDISSITAALGTDIALCPAVTGSPEAPSASLLNPRVAVTRRVCTYCELLQPPRSFHDHDTDRCYEAYEGVFPLSGAPVATSNRRFNSIVIVTLWTALAVATGVMYSYTPNTITPEDEQSVPSRVWDMMWHAPPLPCLLALLVLSRGILARVSLWAANFTAWEWASKSSLPHMFRVKLNPDMGILEPVLSNPFDTGSAMQNLADLLNRGYSSAAAGYSPAALAMRDRSDVEEAADTMRKIMATRANTAAAPCDGVDTAAAHATAHSSPPTSTSPTATSALHLPVESLSAAGERADPPIVVQSVPGVGFTDTPSSPPATFSETTAAVSTAGVLNTVIAMRAAVSRDADTWMQFVNIVASPPRPRQQAHAHSHGGGGGHGHSHG